MEVKWRQLSVLSRVWPCLIDVLAEKEMEKERCNRCDKCFSRKTKPIIKNGLIKKVDQNIKG